jgi:aminopeptidase N
MKRVLILAAVAVATIGVTPAAAAPGAGAPGIGDSYYPLDGNGGYDAIHYDIRVSYQPATDLLSGTTTIQARATKALSSFNLDFLLKVSDVRVNNARAAFRTDAGELTVTPKNPLNKGQEITIVVRYTDTPEPYRLYGGAGWQRTPTGALGVNEPQSAPWWYPSNNHPRDKATFDVSIAVPPGVEALSNGVLVGRQQTTPGLVRWNWRSVRPQAPYLTFMAVGQYEVREATAPNGQVLITAYGDDLGDNGPAARSAVERTPEVIETLEQLFAQYLYDAIPADDEFWQVKPGDPGPAEQFADAVYDRGALTLQALRTAVGDDAFFTILRRWPAAHEYGTATIDQFVALSERVSGQQLDDLFTTWLFTPGKPAVGPNGASAARTATTKPKSFDTIARTHELLAARS